MKKIAITGGIGSGKSKALELLKELGYPTYSCDEIYKSIITTQEYVKQLNERFPTCVENGEINRSKLASIIFDDPQKRKSLNAIAHPLILKSLFNAIELENSNIVFVEVPLLFEEKLENQFDKVIVINRKTNKRIEAIQARDNISQEEAEKRLRAQLDYTSSEAEESFKKCECSDFSVCISPEP